MVRFDNPFDPSKDGQNPIVDGVRFHIRESQQNKENIWNYILKYVQPEQGDRPLDILEYAMKCMNISDSQLTVADEHELLDRIIGYFY